MQIFPGPSAEHEDNLRQNCAQPCNTSESSTKTLANRSVSKTEICQSDIHPNRETTEQVISQHNLNFNHISASRQPLLETDIETISKRSDLQSRFQRSGLGAPYPPILDYRTGHFCVGSQQNDHLVVTNVTQFGLQTEAGEYYMSDICPA